MKRLSILWLVFAFLATSNFAAAQIDPEDPDDLCVPEITTNGFQGTHCHLLQLDGTNSFIQAGAGNCALGRPCSITDGVIILQYTGPPDPNIDVISNEGLIPTVTGGNTYEFDPTELPSVVCHDDMEYTFSLIYYVSGAPYVICEWRYLFVCQRCENEI